jgi:hypothetical protein
MRGPRVDGRACRALLGYRPVGRGTSTVGAGVRGVGDVVLEVLGPDDRGGMGSSGDYQLALSAYGDGRGARTGADWASYPPCLHPPRVVARAQCAVERVRRGLLRWTACAAFTRGFVRPCSLGGSGSSAAVPPRRDTCVSYWGRSTAEEFPRCSPFSCDCLTVPADVVCWFAGVRLLCRVASHGGRRFTSYLRRGCSARGGRESAASSTVFAAFAGVEHGGAWCRAQFWGGRISSEDVLGYV